MRFEDYKSSKLQNKEINNAYNELEPEYEIIRQLIKSREELNLTQSELAKIAGTDQSHISRLENGNYNPSLKFLKKIAEGIGKELHISFLPKQTMKNR